MTALRRAVNTTWRHATGVVRFTHCRALGCHSGTCLRTLVGKSDRAYGVTELDLDGVPCCQRVDRKISCAWRPPLRGESCAVIRWVLGSPSGHATGTRLLVQPHTK